MSMASEHVIVWHNDIGDRRQICGDVNKGDKRLKPKIWGNLGRSKIALDRTEAKNGTLR